MKSVILSAAAALLLAACGAGAAVTTGTVAGTTGQAVNTSYVAPATAAQSTLQAPVAVDSTLAALQTTYENIYAQVNPSVVLIEVAQTTTVSGRFGQQGQQTQQGLGSGFVWDTKGNIVTNNHVIDGADQIMVVFYDGTTVAGKLVATDPQSDLAVVHVDVPASQLKPVQMGDSSKVQVGQLSIAIGNPYGEQNTMTTGIISAVGRFMPTDLNATGPTYQIPDMIQTDTPINPGNSGGVLLDVEGNVIGVTNSIESAAGSSAGVGFAIPAEIVNRVIPALISAGRYDHSYLGLSGTDVTPDIAAAMGLNANQRGGVIADVVAGGPAAKAGVQGATSTKTVNGQDLPVGGDVIVAINGQQVKTFNDVVAYLELSTKPGDKVTLTILRDGKQMDITVTLGTRPATSAQPVSGQGSQNNPFRSNPNQSNPNQGNSGGVNTLT